MGLNGTYDNFLSVTFKVALLTPLPGRTLLVCVHTQDKYRKEIDRMALGIREYRYIKTSPLLESEVGLREGMAWEKGFN